MAAATRNHLSQTASSAHRYSITGGALQATSFIGAKRLILMGIIMGKRQITERGQHLILWLRRLFATAMLCTVTNLSLSDSDGLRRHEITHLLVQFRRLTGIPEDKTVHFLMYAALAGAIWLALPARIRRLPSPLVAFVIAALWGILMEYAQWFVSAMGWGHRSFDVFDMLANACGAAASMILAALVSRTLRRIWHTLTTQK